MIFTFKHDLDIFIALFFSSGWWLTDKQFFFPEKMNYLVTVSTSPGWDLCQTGDRRWLIVFVLILIAASMWCFTFSMENHMHTFEYFGISLWAAHINLPVQVLYHLLSPVDKDLSTERWKLLQGNSFARSGKKTVCLFDLDILPLDLPAKIQSVCLSV